MSGWARNGGILKQSGNRWKVNSATLFNFQNQTNIGEFGAYSKADMDSRQRWTTFVARWFGQQQMTWAYWEFSAGLASTIPPHGSMFPD